jgi:hypothetical protein
MHLHAAQLRQNYSVALPNAVLYQAPLDSSKMGAILQNLSRSSLWKNKY